jgi:hypothetical protein
MCSLGLLFRFILWSCCLLASLPLQAQEGKGHATLHHPPQDQWLHEKFYSTWRMPDNPSASCCNDADCYPTEIQYIDGTSNAKRREDGKYILIPPEKWNAIGIIRMDEIICAHRRPISCSRLIPYTASHWEAPHDAPAAPLRVECRGPIATGCRGTPQKKMLCDTVGWTLTSMVVTIHDR